MNSSDKLISMAEISDRFFSKQFFLNYLSGITSPLRGQTLRFEGARFYQSKAHQIFEKPIQISNQDFFNSGMLLEKLTLLL